MNKFTPPGKTLLATNLESCTLNIGPATLGLNKIELKILFDSVVKIVEEAKTSAVNIITTPPYKLEISDWDQISFRTDIDKYHLTYRGISWSVKPYDMKKCIEEDVLPFLARGTMEKHGFLI